MIVLDENIPAHQRQLLQSWRIRAQLIGDGFSRKGIQDDQILPLLHSLNRPTFFTRDQGFYRRGLCHLGYCLIYLDVRRSEVALLARRFLRHRDFKTRAQRMGKFVRLSSSGIHFWQLHERRETILPWEIGQLAG